MPHDPLGESRARVLNNGINVECFPPIFRNAASYLASKPLIMAWMSPSGGGPFARQRPPPKFR
jgi:hypothetical protein